MTNDEIKKLMEFIVTQQAHITSVQADMVEEQAKFESSTNKKNRVYP